MSEDWLSDFCKQANTPMDWRGTQSAQQQLEYLKKIYAASRPSYPSSLKMSEVLRSRINEAISKAANAIPYRTALKIDAIRFGPEGPDAAFEVVWLERFGRHPLRFENLDDFPTEADIVRITFEAP